MASREERQQTLEGMNDEQLRDFSKRYGGGDVGGGEGSWGDRYIKSVVDKTDRDSGLGKLLDIKLGLLPDDERQLRAAEKVASASAGSACAAKWAVVIALKRERGQATFC